MQSEAVVKGNKEAPLYGLIMINFDVYAFTDMYFSLC